MKSTSEIQQLFETELKPGLLSLESMRKKILLRYIFMALLILLSIGATLLVGEQYSFLIFIAIAVILFALVIIYQTWRMNKDYVRQFKQEVVRKIVEMINPQWSYNPDGRISQSDYRRSELFTENVDRYKGDDLVTGIIERTDFQFSELHTEYKTVTHKDGKREEHWHTIFKGLFAHADFNKEIKGKTIVLPDTAEKLFGKWGQNLQKMSSHGKLIKLENSEFEKEFVVYGSDQIESRYVLTPGMMEAMVNIKKKYKRRIYFSFIGSRVYMAMSFSKDLFEPRIFSSGVKLRDVEQMNEQFLMIESLIQELNLNTRIWTKD